MNCTPSDKAKSLFSKYIINQVTNDKIDNNSYNSISRAKDSALILVDELILNSLSNKTLSLFGDYYEFSLEYWQDVKIEIENEYNLRLNKKGGY